MPNWLALALKNITPITNLAGGLVELFKHAKDEIASADDPAAKAKDVTSDIAAAADDVGKALLASTPHE